MIDWNEELLEASQKGNLEVVKYSIHSGADVSVDNYSAIKIANENNHPEVVHLLMEKCIEKEGRSIKLNALLQKEHIPDLNKSVNDECLMSCH